MKNYNHNKIDLRKPISLSSDKGIVVGNPELSINIIPVTYDIVPDPGFKSAHMGTSSKDYNEIDDEEYYIVVDDFGGTKKLTYTQYLYFKEHNKKNIIIKYDEVMCKTKITIIPNNYDFYDFTYDTIMIP